MTAAGRGRYYERRRTMSTERGILMSGWAVGRLLANEKTQTRRPIKRQPTGYPSFYTRPVSEGRGLFAADGKHKGAGMGTLSLEDGRLELYGAQNFERNGGLAWQHAGEMEHWKSPYGVPGDLLYVREELKKTPNLFSRYAVDGEWVAGSDTLEHWWKWKRNRLPGRFMPKWAARIWLRITDVRLEQVQEISYEDIVAEGCEVLGPGFVDGEPPSVDAAVAHDVMWDILAQDKFRDQWDSIYAARGLAYEGNPWAWVYTFERIKRKDAE